MTLCLHQQQRSFSPAKISDNAVNIFNDNGGIIYKSSDASLTDDFELRMLLYYPRLLNYSVCNLLCLNSGEVPRIDLHRGCAGPKFPNRGMQQSKYLIWYSLVSLTTEIKENKWR